MYTPGRQNFVSILVLLVLITFSFYNYYLFSNQIYLQIMFGFIFFRYEFPRRSELQSLS